MLAAQAAVDGAPVLAATPAPTIAVLLTGPCGHFFVAARAERIVLQGGSPREQAEHVS